MLSVLPVLETGFPQWENFPDTFFAYFHEPEFLSTEPIFPNSGSDTSTPNQYQHDVEPEQEGNLVLDEKKRKRKFSNRESAKRSRKRKEKHLENLRLKANTLKDTKQDLMNQLGHVTRGLHVVGTDYDRLRNESILLSHKLWALQQVMLVRELHNHIPTTTTWSYNNIMTPIIQEILP